MRVLFFGTYDAAAHPRVAVLRDGLRAALGPESTVAECNAPLGLSTAEISEIRQGRHNNGPYPNVPGKFGGRNLGVSTRTFRIEAEGIVDDRVTARLTAIVQKRTDVDPPSVDRKIPLWCWHHTTSGSAAQRDNRCGSWMTGSKARSGGMNAARMPEATVHVAPASSLRHAPPHDTPTSTVSAARGSTLDSTSVATSPA